MNRVTPYFRAFLVLVCLTATLFCVSKAWAGSVTLTWTAPTTRTDGSALTNLAGYRIYHGTAAASITTRVDVSVATATSHVLSGLPAGVRYFQMTAVDANGVESARTSVLSTTVVDAPPSPPNNVQVTVQAADTNAYKQRFATDSFSLVSIGSVPVGTVLDTSRTVSDSTGVYCAVSRAAVTLRNRFDVLPLITYAKCA